VLWRRNSPHSTLWKTTTKVFVTDAGKSESTQTDLFYNPSEGRVTDPRVSASAPFPSHVPDVKDSHPPGAFI